MRRFLQVLESLLGTDQAALHFRSTEHSFRSQTGLFAVTPSANPPFLLPAELPPPDKHARAHGEAMLAHLLAEIDAAGGWISFYRYMELCLYAPGLGYYSAGSRKLGEQGDFVTAPELSPLFGGCVAR